MRPYESRDRSLVVWGGVAGVVMTVVYGLGQALPEFGFDPSPAGAMRVFFLIAAVFGPLGVVNSYAIYRVLAWERDGAPNRLSLVLSVLAYGAVTIMLLVQGSVGYYAADLDAAGASVDLLRAVDLGIDLA